MRHVFTLAIAALTLALAGCGRSGDSGGGCPSDLNSTGDTGGGGVEDHLGWVRLFDLVLLVHLSSPLRM